MKAIKEFTIKHFTLIFIALSLYYSIIAITKPVVLNYQFHDRLIQQYLRSQDITHDVAMRSFLSDSDIHIAAGFLYASGADPAEYNFQHPPFIKYLFGVSILIFNNFDSLPAGINKFFLFVISG